MNANDARLAGWIKGSVIVALAALVAACGGGGSGRSCSDDPNRDPRLPSCSPAPAPGTSQASSVDVLVTSPQLPADGTSTVVLTFRALDAHRVGVAGRPVTVAVEDPAGTAFISNFSQPGGATGVRTTDANGQLTATLSAGTSKANRPIVVRATVDGVTTTNTVNVTGTSLRTSGANALGFGATTQLAFVLTDAAGVPIGGVPVTFTSAAGNALNPADAVTDASGTVRTTVTGSRTGRDTITASALGASTAFELTVSADNFAFTSPSPGTTVQATVNVPQTVTVRWTSSGGAVAGQPVNFFTTRGTLSADQVLTNANGNATVTITSPFPGPATVTASTVGGALVATANLNFVGTNIPAKIDLQADRTTVPVNAAGSSANVVNLQAVVRDAADNRVSGATVTFNIEQDTSSGALSAPSAVTDANGVARAQFIPSTNPSQTNGVVIRAVVRNAAGTPIANATIALTVGGQRLFVRIGTDNSIEDNPPVYLKRWVAFVTDAGGNPVPNAQVQFLLRTRQDVGFDATRVGDTSFVASFLMRDTTPLPGLPPLFDYAYFKGFWVPVGDFWQQIITARCFNEDVNFNGIRDPGEDKSGDGALQPGNVFSVQQTVTTNAAGFATAEIQYPQDRAMWTVVTLKATALVAGTEAVDSATFVLPIAAADVELPGSPPGAQSPYGRSTSCSDPN